MSSSSGWPAGSGPSLLSMTEPHLILDLVGGLFQLVGPGPQQGGRVGAESGAATRSGTGQRVRPRRRSLNEPRPKPGNRDPDACVPLTIGRRRNDDGPWVPVGQTVEKLYISLPAMLGRMGGKVCSIRSIAREQVAGPDFA